MTKSLDLILHKEKNYVSTDFAEKYCAPTEISKFLQLPIFFKIKKLIELREKGNLYADYKFVMVYCELKEFHLRYENFVKNIFPELLSSRKNSINLSAFYYNALAYSKDTLAYSLVLDFSSTLTTLASINDSPDFLHRLIMDFEVVIDMQNLVNISNKSIPELSSLRLTKVMVLEIVRKFALTTTEFRCLLIAYYNQILHTPVEAVIKKK